MLQTVHYEYIDGNLKKSGSCPFFLEPFAIAEQSDEDLKKSKQGVEAVEDISDVEDDRFPNSGDMNMLNMKWRYLVSSPVLMTLKGLLPLYGKPNRIGGMNGLLDRPWVSPFLTIDWCRDLLLAVNHLLNW